MDNFNVMLRIFANLLLLGLMVLAVLFLFPKLLLLLLPFVIAYFISLMVNPAVNFLHSRLRFPRKLAVVLMILITVTVISVIITLIVSAVVGQAVSLAENWQSMFDAVSDTFRHVVDQYYGLFNILSPEVQGYITGALANLAELAGKWAGSAASVTMQNVGSFAMKIPTIFIFTVILMISSFFMTAEKESISKTVKKWVGEKLSGRYSLMKHELKSAFGGYIKAQVMIMSVVFVELFISFTVQGNRYALLLALLIAVFDAFPFLGSGAFLIPWSLIGFLMGDLRIGITVLVTYVLILLTRQFMEPKVVGDNIGLHPLVTLMSMYVGLQVFGVIGMIIGPILTLLLRRMYLAGMLDFLVEIFQSIWQDVKHVTGITARQKKRESEEREASREA